MIINQVVNGGGTTPTGTKNITANGVYDVTDYASADVQVPTTAPAHYVEKSVDANGKLTNSNQIIDLTGVTDIGDNALAYSYRNVSTITGTVDLPNITTISGTYAFLSAFEQCLNATSCDLSSVTLISGANSCQNMFMNCISLTSFNLSSLETVSGNSACNNMFRQTKITTVSLPALKTINNNNAFNYTFAYCNYLTTINLPVLETIQGSNACAYMFTNCPLITTVNLSSIKTISGYNVIGQMFGNCQELTTVNMDGLDSMPQQLAATASTTVFGGCNKLESVSFGGLKSSTFAGAQNQLQYLFNGTTGSTAPNGCTVHFPSNFDPSDPSHTFDASTLAGYPTFGGNASYIHVAFDLTATE